MLQFWLGDHSDILGPLEIVSVEPVSCNFPKVWLFPFLQCKEILEKDSSPFKKGWEKN